MLLIEELVRFGADLDEDYRHPIATAVAARWGLPAPLFVRSSAAHVFVAGSVVLRLRPAEHEPALERSARAANAWHDAGAPMVPAVPSQTGRLVEVVDGYAGMALGVANGPTLEELADGLVERAAEWGAALGQLHASVTGLPDAPVVAPLGLPQDEGVFGVLHGDPEPDNVVAADDGLVFVDPDEVRRGWYAADIAFALRDWTPGDDVPRLFLEGYRSMRPFTAEEESWLPALRKAAMAEEREGLQPHPAAPPDPAWPDWARDLDERIRTGD